MSEAERSHCSFLRGAQSAAVALGPGLVNYRTSVRKEDIWPEKAALSPFKVCANNISYRPFREKCH